jgi:hypothetical protein
MNAAIALDTLNNFTDVSPSFNESGWRRSVGGIVAVSAAIKKRNYGNRPFPKVHSCARVKTKERADPMQ